MSSGTEREETRKVATRCAVSSPAHTLSQGLTETQNAGFELLRHPSYSPDLSLSDFYLFPKLKNFMKGRKFTDDNDVICTANGWLEDEDQEFFYNGRESLDQVHFCRRSIQHNNSNTTPLPTFFSNFTIGQTGTDMFCRFSQSYK